MATRSVLLLRKNIDRLRNSLASLDRSLRRLTPLLTASVTTNRRRRPRLTAKGRASLVLQGRYMGYMRQLKPRQKAQVRRVKEARGVRVAIQRARGLCSR